MKLANKPVQENNMMMTMKSSLVEEAADEKSLTSLKQLKKMESEDFNLHSSKEMNSD